MWKWEQHGNVWIFVNMPIITIEPADGELNGFPFYQICFGGIPVKAFPPSPFLRLMKRQAELYLNKRIEMETVKERW